jgi:hypothetical protein
MFGLRTAGRTLEELQTTGPDAARNLDDQRT